MTDIQAGDVVVCVSNEPRIEVSPIGFEVMARLQVGKHYRVADTVAPDGLVLDAVSASPWRAYGVEFFRKIEPASDDFTQAIRACQPIIPELPRVTVEIVKLNPEIWGEGINDIEGECCSAAPRSHPSDHARSGHGAPRFDRISQGEE